MADDLLVAVATEKEYPDFDVPEGFDLSNYEAGQEVEVLAKIKKSGDGKLSLLEIDGYPLGDPYGDVDDDEEEPEDEVSDEEVAEEVTSDGTPFEERVMNSARARGLV